MMRMENEWFAEALYDRSLKSSNIISVHVLRGYMAKVRCLRNKKMSSEPNINTSISYLVFFI